MKTWPSLALVALTGCLGLVGDPGETEPGGGPSPGPSLPDPTGGAGIDPDERPLRPLNRRELDHTLADLLGVDGSGLTDSIPADSRALVYDRVGAARTNRRAPRRGLSRDGGRRRDAGDGRRRDPRPTHARMRPVGARTARPTVGSYDSRLVAHVERRGVEAVLRERRLERRKPLPRITDPSEVRLQFGGSGARLTTSIGSDGPYRIDVLASGVGSSASLRVDVDDVTVGTVPLTVSATSAARHFDSYSIDVTLSGGDHRIDFVRVGDTAYLRGVTIEGPSDVDATRDAPARDACAAALIASFAPRAWRRPLASDEEAEIASLFAAGRDSGFFFDGLRMAVEYVLTAPELLYHVELGTPTGEPGTFRLTDYEVAARLSYLAWESMPDDELWLAAQRGELRTTDQIRAQAERLFADPRAHDTVMRFYEQWLDLDALDSLTKDTTLFPEFTNAVREAMGEETRTFLSEMTWTEGADMNALLTEPRTWLPPDLAEVYGLPVTGATAEVTLPPERLGLLTQPSLLAVHSKPNSQSPVRRGVFVLRRILCEEPPPPPPGVDFTAVDRSTATTTRERYAEHSQNPACATCHSQIDPIGFTFEEFDTLGRFQTEEGGSPIDSTGGIPALGVEAGSIDGAVELATALAATDQPSRCLGRQWLRFGLGRMEDQTDTGALDAMYGALTTSGIRGMLVELAATDAFVRRMATEEEASR